MLKKENLPSSFLFIPWVILIFGLALTYALQDTPREANRQALHDEFEYRSNEIIDNINRRLQNYEQVLEGVAGLFTASHKVTQAEFSRYVETLKFEDKFPGIQGVGLPVLLSRKKKQSTSPSCARPDQKNTISGHQVSARYTLRLLICSRPTGAINAQSAMTCTRKPFVVLR
jgi:CHASE1-domain containing sensor protein